MVRRIVTTLGAMVVLLASADVHAQDLPRVDTRDDIAFRPPGATFEPAAQKPKRATTWYGWQILAVDVASIASISSAGGYGMIFGGPAVHALNGQSKKAWESFGLRLGLPFAGALIGMAAVHERNCGRQGCDGLQDLVGIAYGAAAGWLTAAIVDAAYLARKPRRSRERRVVKIPVQPSVRMVKGGAVLGMRSTF